MDASDPRENGPNMDGQGRGRAEPEAETREVGLISGATAPLWAAVLFAERLRRSEGAARGLICGVGDGALGRLGAAGFGAGERLEAAGVGFEPVLSAEIAAAVHAGAQKSGAGAFGVFYASAESMLRGGAAALRRARGSGAPGGAVAVVADDLANAGEAASAAAALKFFGAPILHPATPIEAATACLAALECARKTGDWNAVALPLGVAEATAHKPEAGAALADVTENWIADRRTHGPSAARFGAVALGGGWSALDRAMALLGLDETAAAELSFSVWRVTRTEPIDADALRAYATGLHTLFVVDAGGLAEATRSALYGLQNAPTIEVLAAPRPPFEAEALAVLLAVRLAGLDSVDAARCGPLLAEADALAARLDDVDAEPIAPARAGADAAEWIGAARWSNEGRRTVRLDSLDLDAGGFDAIRAAARAGAPTTFLICWRPSPLWMQPARLEEDALAEAPGEDPAAPSAMAARLTAAGVTAIGLLENPGQPIDRRPMPSGTLVEDGGDLDALEAELAAEGGVAAILDLRGYEGAESLRRFSLTPEATVAAINPAICDGCGDCDRARSGAFADRVHVRKIETETGSARRLDFASASVDATLLPGSCPAFIGAAGARRRPLRVPSAPPAPAAGFAPGRAAAAIGFSGGKEAAQTARILASAARRDGRSVGLWVAAEDGRGCAAPFGLTAVCRIDSGVRVQSGLAECALAAPPALGELDALIACGAETPPAALFRDPARAQGSEGPSPQELGALYFGVEAQAGLIALGAAHQQGHLPVSAEALADALSAECKTTRARAESAFELGRASAAPGGVPVAPAVAQSAASLDALIEQRAKALADYQNAAWAERYVEAVASAARSEKIVAPESEALTRAVAEGLFALMSYRDVYETARLLADTTEAAAERAFEPVDGAPLKPVIYLRSALLAGRDSRGAPRKVGFGTWILPIMRLLKHGAVFRGGALDPAGWSRLRRLERELIRQYEQDLVAMGRDLSPERLKLAVEIARLPLEIRGFGPVKERAIAVAEVRRKRLWSALRAGRGLGAPKAAEPV